MTAGPWRPVHLHTYAARIDDLDVRASVAEDNAAKVTVDLALAGAGATRAEINVTGLAQSTAKVDAGHASATFELGKDKVELWYPVGYGAQKMYEAVVEVFDEVHPPQRFDVCSERALIGRSARCTARQAARLEDAEDCVPARASRAGQAYRPAGPDLPLRG